MRTPRHREVWEEKGGDGSKGERVNASRKRKWRDRM